MKKFILKRTTDGLHHLYLDDSSEDVFLKISAAQNAELLNENKFAVLSGEDSNTKTLYGIIDNEFFQIVIPQEAKIKFIDNICIFEQDGLWHTMKFNRGSWHAQTLGEMHTEGLNGAEIIKYNKIIWKYFLKHSDGSVVISHIVNGRIFAFGPYSKIQDCSPSKIIVTRAYGDIHIFAPNSIGPLVGKDEEMFTTAKGLYIWSETLKSWIFHANCRSFGKNAIYQIFGNKYGDKIELYRIKNAQLELIATGEWELIGGEKLYVDGTIYTRDRETNLVDFDKPKRTIKKRLKDFLKLK